MNQCKYCGMPYKYAKLTFSFCLVVAKPSVNFAFPFLPVASIGSSGLDSPCVMVKDGSNVNYIELDRCYRMLRPWAWRSPVVSKLAGEWGSLSNLNTFFIYCFVLSINCVSRVSLVRAVSRSGYDCRIWLLIMSCYIRSKLEVVAWAFVLWSISAFSFRFLRRWTLMSTMLSRSFPSPIASLAKCYESFDRCDFCLPADLPDRTELRTEFSRADDLV